MARQRVLNRPNPLRYHVILTDTVLTTPIGTRAVMRGQLARLVDAAESEHITIQVLPRSAGATPAVDGPFSVLTLPDPIPDFGYAEGQGGAMYIEDREHVRELLQRWGISHQARAVARRLAGRHQGRRGDLRVGHNPEGRHMTFTWRRSIFSGSGGTGGGNCVEAARLDTDRFALRDSKNPDSTMPLSRGGMAALLAHLSS
jgi:Domain of unknown function (DUF5753)/Domain of unknown function (DUF397)